ncbi:MAG: hypothetical protein ACLGH8_15000 [Bacteroidia bacterium]
MKVASLAIVSLLLFSCTPDTTNETITATAYKAAVSEAANLANPYDRAGALRNEILNAVSALVPKTVSLDQLNIRINSVAEGNAEFNSYKTPSYTPLSVSKLQSLLETDTTVSQVVFVLPLSPYGKTALTGFLEDLLSISGEEFETIYDYIVAYEQGVLESTSYTDADKELILTLTSLERYAAYYRKKPKDKDWDLLITHIAAESEGASQDMATAIFYSVGIESALHP